MRPCNLTLLYLTLNEGIFTNNVYGDVYKLYTATVSVSLLQAYQGNGAQCFVILRHDYVSYGNKLCNLKILRVNFEI